MKSSSPPETRRSKSQSPSRENLVDQPRRSGGTNHPANPVSQATNPAFTSDTAKKQQQNDANNSVANNNTVVNPAQIKVEPKGQHIAQRPTSSPDSNISTRTMAELTALVSRLEAVTSRLEGVAGGGGGGGGRAAPSG